MRSEFIRNVFRINLGLAFVEGLFVFWQYIQTPSEPDAAVFLGFSPLRLAILLGVLVVLAVIIYLFIASFAASWSDGMNGRIVLQVLERPVSFWILLPMLGLVYFLVFATDPYLGFVSNYRERLFPIFIWAAILVFQLLVSWLYARAIGLNLFENFRDVFVPAGIALLLIVTILCFIGLTRIGLTPDDVYWQEAGVPILFAQVLLVFGAGLLLHVLFTKLNIADNRKFDVLIFVALWAFAFIVWGGQTARPAYNMLEPAPPNFQGYPFGDAMLYDVTAQNFLIGEPIPADFWAKPLYSFFLSILHLIAGQDFRLVSLLQVAFLSFIPAVVYLLTKILGGPLSGIVAALLVIVREWNAIRLSNVIQVSHVKLLLSDVFAMGGMILLTWLMLQWLEKPSVRRGIPIAVGGAMGLLILMRGHPVLIVPFVFLIGLLFLRGDRPLLWESSWKLVAGLSLVMLPWFWHTYDLTGRFAFQDNSSSFATKDAFVQTFADSSGNDPASYGQFEAQIFQQVLTRPLYVAQFISAHYSHNAIFSYVFLPQSFRTESLREYVKRLPFWGNWDGTLSVEAWILLLIHTSILALGIGAAWKRTKGLIFVPWVIGAAYNLSVAVSRRSGWRFIQPADWVTLVFYAIGLVQIILIVYSLVRRSMSEQSNSRPAESVVPVRAGWNTVFIGLPFLFITLALVLGHKLFPVAYPLKEESELVRMYQQAQGNSELDDSQIDEFLQQENATILYGKALYPIYFKSDTGALNYSWMSFAPKPYKRLALYVTGPEAAGVIFASDARPATFPDGADVIVLGCKTETGDVDALSIVLMSTETPVLYSRDPMPALKCPLSEPQ